LLLFQEAANAAEKAEEPKFESSFILTTNLFSFLAEGKTTGLGDETVHHPQTRFVFMDWQRA